MSASRRTQAVLAASERICWHLIERGDTAATVAEMATSTGLNERTFYRYFPTRHDVVRPVFEWGATLMADWIADRRDLTIKEAIVGSFDQIVGGEHAERTRLLFPMAFADPGLRAVLLAVYHDAEDEIRKAIAKRGGPAADSVEAFVASATIVGVTRVALEVMVARDDDPVETLRSCMDVLPDHLIGQTADVSLTSASKQGNWKK